MVKGIDLNSGSAKLTKPYEYAMRFLFGGLCTILAGWIASRYGPTVGGLFLAFPAIFPASASLIEDHEKRRKSKIGVDGRVRGRMAASLDSAGTSLGCIGLFVFALFVEKFLIDRNAYVVIGLAAVLWTATASACWLFWIHRPRSRSERRPSR